MYTTKIGSITVMIMKPSTSDHKNLEKLLDKGHDHYRDKEFDKAIESCMEIIEVDPTHYNAWFLLGDTYLERGKINSNNEDYIKAIECYEMIIKFKIDISNRFYAWEGMGLAYEGLGNEIKAKECFDNWTKSRNEYIDSLMKPKYVTTWRNKWITANASSIDDFIKTFEHLAKMFKQWKEMGIELYPESSTEDDYAEFYTEDMDVAIKAHFTVTMGDHSETVYLITDRGKKVSVPKEKL
jgi:tetratricopeptide (TPR) repeat protein